MIHVLATVETNDGARNDFLAEFRKVAELVRQEQGCIEYGATIDCQTGIEVQNHVGPNGVIIVEKWESLPALKAHLAAKHMQDYRLRIRPFVRRVDLKVLEPA